MTDIPIRNVTDSHSIVTAIPSSETFPDFLEGRVEKYEEQLEEFIRLLNKSESSAQLLEKIRTPRLYTPKVRMTFLKIFRRCVCTVADTEATKKLKTPNSVFVENYGHLFKDIDVLKEQFNNINEKEKYALISLIGEYDNRGQQGYILTRLFFEWFENNFEELYTIEGPRGAGLDPQLSVYFPEFEGDFPCDFVIKRLENDEVVAVGLARYDSTRGGAQSDDRTGGNSDKVFKAKQFRKDTGHKFKLIFVSDGPGLTHRDTWEEAVRLDEAWENNVRVVTLKTAQNRITHKWLESE